MHYDTNNLHHMILDEPRESWPGIVKPLILEEDSSGMLLQDNYYYNIL